MTRHARADELYARAAREAAGAVIATYSTSFTLACALLGPRVRDHVRNVYALVRVADEIVDGTASAAGVAVDGQRKALDALEASVTDAIHAGFSTNLIVHAFALTARECGIDESTIAPFFRSMRMDLERTRHDRESHDEYVYGSAEVIGLMCLAVFVRAGGRREDPSPHVHDGARRLGAAFQNINFLRDLEADRIELGRDYLAMTHPGRWDEILDGIDRDLDAAAAVIPLLPADCRRAVATAHGLFSDLARRLRHGERGAHPRVRVPNLRKAVIAARAVVGLPNRRMAS